MDIRKAHTEMIKAYDGGWEVMAAALGMSKDALENRVYERKGQSVSVHTSLQMQKFSKTTFFAEAISAESGGVFIKLPDFNACDHDELLHKFNQLYAELGKLSEKFMQHTKDGQITKKEKSDLTETGQKIHRNVQELLAIAFAIYCPEDKNSNDEKYS